MTIFERHRSQGERASKDDVKIIVREASKIDLPPILRNMRQVARAEIYIATEKVTKATGKYYLERLTDKISLTIVAVHEEKIIGALTLWPYWNLRKTKHVTNLGMLVVDGYRRSGVGSALMKFALNWANQTKRIEKITLGVFSTNIAAFNLYKKFGFQVEGVLRRQHIIRGNHVDEIEMALFLGESVTK
jgi:RimJ/RimL family protein N-acetyltransferase